MNDLLEQFLLEARDLIEEASSGLLEIERDGTPERMNAVFRALHTLKGSSGLFDFPPLTTLLHAAEDRLSALCRTGAGVSPDLVDLLLQTFDQTSEWLAQIEAEGRLPADAPVAEARLVAALRSGLADGQAMGSAKRAAMDVPSCPGRRRCGSCGPAQRPAPGDHRPYQGWGSADGDHLHAGFVLLLQWRRPAGPDGAGSGGRWM